MELILLGDYLSSSVALCLALYGKKSAEQKMHWTAFRHKKQAILPLPMFTQKWRALLNHAASNLSR
jgi:hypothetical protein